MSAVVFVLLATLTAAPSEWLLTDNGLNNPRYSEYKNATFLRTGGRYIPRPAFSSQKGAPAIIPFASGALTNGDSTFNWKREPGPYCHWTRIARGEVEFDLLKPFRIMRVRVCVLNRGPHGTAKIELFKRGDPLEFPEMLKLAELKAKDGWNEFAGIDTIAGGVRLRFTRQPGKSYITISEVEIWGRPAPASALPAAPRRLSRKSIRQQGIEWYAFDFGPHNSLTFANFTGVSKDLVYTKQRGYGWLPYRDGRPVTPSNFGPESKVVPGLGERDRGARGTSVSGSLYRDFVCSYKYYHTQVRQSFALDVPNGLYRVVSFHGDEVYGRPGRQNWWIEAEGRRVVEHPNMPQSLQLELVFDVRVEDGQLTLTFDAQHPDPARCGFGIGGLVVLPINDARQRAFAEAKIEKIRAAIKREQKEIFETLFVEKPYVERAKMPPVSDADRERGYVPFVPNWMRNIYPNSVPRPHELGRPVSCFACPGEYEPMAVAVRALKDLHALSCEVTDLRGPAGRIPARAMDVRVVRCWPQRLGSSWSTEWRVMPELLEHKPSVNVPKDTSKEFWLTIHLPDDAKPGIYRGEVILRARNAGTARIPMQVEVLPFRLRKNERPVGMYWYEHMVIGTPMRDKQVRDMIEHGMTTLTLGRLTPDIRYEDGRIVLDTGKLLRFLQELKRLGIEGPIPYHISWLMRRIKLAAPGKTQTEYDALYVAAIRQLEAVSSRPDTPKLLYYPVDEIGNSPKRGARAHHECALIAKVPGATSYITVNNYKAGERWGDTFDIWCGNIVYTREQEQKLLARGKRYMRYGSAYLNDPRKARNSCGFGFYRRPAEAMFYWHYQCYKGDPFNDFDGGCRDHCAAYPGPNGALIPTTDWEGLREGVDDMRYIATLKHYAALAAKTPRGRAAAERALKTLNEVLAPDDPNLSQYTFRSDLTTDEFHALRRKLVEAILELLKVVPR